MAEDGRQICTRCVLDTTATDIWFTDNGVCKYCMIHDELEKAYPHGAEGDQQLERIASRIRAEGKGKPHDCIVGVSGGRDSTFTLYTAVNLGLRPLAVHFDNGWNSEIAVRNIENATTRLGVELHTVVADWEEFKDLQLAFLRASVPDAEVPTDYAIYSVLFESAVAEGVRYVLEGHSFRTEGTSPISWSYMDGRYIRAIHRQFGSGRAKSFPIMSLTRLLYFLFVKRIRHVRPLEYIDYQQQEVNRILEEELDWEYYGGHHHESIYTQFFQSYLLPQKFGIDKRKTEYSALIRSGQREREEALEEITRTPYTCDPEVVEYAIKKLGLDNKHFQEIMRLPIRSFEQFPSYYSLIRSLRVPIRIAARLHAVPPILYLKYAR